MEGITIRIIVDCFQLGAGAGAIHVCVIMTDDSQHEHAVLCHFCYLLAVSATPQMLDCFGDPPGADRSHALQKSHCLNTVSINQLISIVDISSDVPEHGLKIRNRSHLI